MYLLPDAMHMTKPPTTACVYEQSEKGRLRCCAKSPTGYDEFRPGLISCTGQEEPLSHWTQGRGAANNKTGYNRLKSISAILFLTRTYLSRGWIQCLGNEEFLADGIVGLGRLTTQSHYPNGYSHCPASGSSIS